MRKKGQNIVEYVLLVAAVTVTMILFLMHKKDAPMEKALTNSLGAIDRSIQAINKEISLDGPDPVPLHSTPNP